MHKKPKVPNFHALFDGLHKHAKKEARGAMLSKGENLANEVRQGITPSFVDADEYRESIAVEERGAKVVVTYPPQLDKIARLNEYGSSTVPAHPLWKKIAKQNRLR